MEARDNTTVVLLVSPIEEDHRLMSGILGQSGWKLRLARSYEQATSVLHGEDVAVVLAEADLPDGTSWRDLLSKLDGTPPLIVTSRLADNLLWAEVLNLGAYDLLMKPFDRTEVLRVIGSCCRSSSAVTLSNGAGS